MGSFIGLILLGMVAGILPAKMPALLARSLPAPARSAASAPEGLPELPTLPDAFPAASLEDLPPETREIVESVRKEQEAIMNPLMKNLMRKPGAKKASNPITAGWNRTRDSIEGAARRYHKPLLQVVRGVVLGLAVLALGTLLAGQRGSGRALAEWCAAVSCYWLLAWSAVTAGVFVFFGVDLFTIGSSGLWWAPALGALASAVMLRSMDLNSPVWNTAFLSLSAPLVSCAVSFGWSFVKGAVNV